MATRTNIESWKRNIDDWTDPCWSSVVDENGVGRGPIRFRWSAFKKFTKNRDRGTLQSRTAALIKAGEFEFVRAILLKHLKVVLLWAKVPDPDQKPRHTEPWLVEYRRTARALSTRSTDVAVWMIGCGLPPIPGVSWDKLARLLALTRTRSSRARRKILPAIKNCRDLIETGLIAGAAEKPRKKRTPSGETPDYVWEAIILLRQSEGRLSARKIAAELGCDPSSLSRHKLFQEAKKPFIKETSSRHEQMEKEARAARVPVNKLLSNMRTNRPEEG
ncbi:MAG: hypothetical protein M5U26_30390 [Planctomycetota bacterium]|nr:hypothetical protein [Planctomycetota bacterium]